MLKYADPNLELDLNVALVSYDTCDVIPAVAIPSKNLTSDSDL